MAFGKAIWPLVVFALILYVAYKWGYVDGLEKALDREYPKPGPCEGSLPRPCTEV